MRTQPKTGLKIRIDALVEAAPWQYRQAFRQAVVDTVLRLVRTRDVEVEYVLYKPEAHTQHLPGVVCDRVFLSFTVNAKVINHFKRLDSKSLIETFAEMFESIAHRPLDLAASDGIHAAFTSRWTWPGGLS